MPFPLASEIWTTAIYLILMNRYSDTAYYEVGSCYPLRESHLMLNEGLPFNTSRVLLLTVENNQV